MKESFQKGGLGNAAAIIAVFGSKRLSRALVLSPSWGVVFRKQESRLLHRHATLMSVIAFSN
ncbi:hypothetical protein D5I55_10340 [Chakrabartia godavariana]|nr:hypothetical protein D5I55_10340 [Chakrabartia godavariana]